MQSPKWTRRALVMGSALGVTLLKMAEGRHAGLPVIGRSLCGRSPIQQLRLAPHVGEDAEEARAEQKVGRGFGDVLCVALRDISGEGDSTVQVLGSDRPDVREGIGSSTH